MTRHFADDSILIATIFKKGQRGPEVRLLQEQLKMLAFDPGPIDGVFGDQTEKAVKSLQYAYGIPGGQTGVVDQRTFELIVTLVEGLGIPKSTTIRPVDPVVSAPPSKLLIPAGGSSRKTMMWIGGGLIGAAVLAILLSGPGSGRRPAMAGAPRRKRKRYAEHATSTKIWSLRRGEWIIERVIDDDSKSKSRWLSILKSDEPTIKFKVSKEKPQ